MKRVIFIILLPAVIFASCSNQARKADERVITVSIPPLSYFVEAIADSDFVINVMLPPGADHHSWEPLPGQIADLAGSEAFIINGKLGFEYAWMSRFREVNPEMKIIDMSEGITLIKPETEAGEDHDHYEEGVDPHYWLSPREALKIAARTKDILIELNPSAKELYITRYEALVNRIGVTDTLIRGILGGASSRSFMIFHPALGYLARDYNLEQISFEDEGKETSPLRIKELINLADEKGIKVILIQAEYDIKSAGVLAEETGASLVRINPMNSDWESGVMDIVKALGNK